MNAFPPDLSSHVPSQTTTAAPGALSAEAYDRAERTARQELPNRIVEVFQPVTFAGLGYPIHVDDVEQLWKYVDVMQELRFEHDFTHLLGGLTEREFELFMQVNDAVLGLSLGYFGKPMVVRAALLRAVNTWRQIRFLVGDARPTVMEVGCGSGYLAALLARDGFPVIANDVTQGFYLYQHLLWSHLAPGGVRQVVETDERLTQLSQPAPGQILHLPWWRFYDAAYEQTGLSAGLITCNHALCEMHPRSFYYFMLLSQRLLANHAASTGTPGLFAFEGSGTDHNVPMWYINSRFYKYGHGLCHHDGGITVYADRATTQHTAAYPHFDFANMADATMVQRFAEQKIGTMWELRYFTPAGNPWSARVQSGRQMLRPTVDLAKVQAALRDLYGGEPGATPDELFFHTIQVS